MHLVQILLPTRKRSGESVSRDAFDSVRQTLTDQYGGATAWNRSPAKGTWVDPDGRTETDEIVMVEVMCPTLDRVWWISWCRELETLFDQEEIIIRASPIERIGKQAPAAR